jgi:hypothetical protein
VSALSLSSVTGGSGDDKLKEEKKKTEAERQKNGSTFVVSANLSQNYLYIFRFSSRNASKKVGVHARRIDENSNSVSKGNRKVGKNQQRIEEAAFIARERY